MSAIKHAFENIGHGIEDAAKSLGKDLEGAGKVIGGCLTLNPNEIKSGIGEVGDGLKQGISGLGKVAGGVAGGVVGMTPLGAAINALSNNSLSNMCEGVANSCADTLNNGINGIGQVAEGAATGNFKEMLSGAINVGQVAMLAVPGAGEAKAAEDIALGAGKDLLKQGVEQEVMNNV
jgi:phage-related protein